MPYDPSIDLRDQGQLGDVCPALPQRADPLMLVPVGVLGGGKGRKMIWPIDKLRVAAYTNHIKSF